MIQRTQLNSLFNRDMETSRIISGTYHVIDHILCVIENGKMFDSETSFERRLFSLYTVVTVKYRNARLVSTKIPEFLCFKFVLV